jgi:hypothetical protein
MDEARFNLVAVIEDDKMKRICVHIRPVVAETGRLFAYSHSTKIEIFKM